MSRIRGKNSKPEIAVRKLIYSLGYRYRLHAKTLPGRPDLVFAGRKKVIFVHGCFWHCHGCKKGQPPKSNLDYWSPKLQENINRDNKNVLELEAAGWEVLIVWQCEIKDIDNIERKVVSFLNDSKNRDKYD
jgi:DNA mismatch endonuclease (patch repair protein)